MGLLDSFMPGETGGLPDGGYGSTPMNTGYGQGMQGLLQGNNPLFNIGMGILANNYGHYGAFGPAVGMGVQQGIQNTQQANKLAQIKKIQDMQIAEQQRKQAADKAYSDAISQSFKPASSQPNMSFMDANNQAMQPQGLLGNPTDIANPQSLPQAAPQSDYQWNQTPATFDKQAMLNAVLSDPNIDGQQKFATYQAMQKDDTPIKIGKDDRLLAKNPDGSYKTLVDALPDPTKDNTPSAIREYQFAKDQGYGGSFLDFQLAQKKAGASTTQAITNVNAYEPFKNKLQGKMGETLVANYETLQNAPATIKAMDTAKQAAAAAHNFLGSGANTKLNLAKFFNNNLGTNIDPEGVASTEQLKSALFYNVMDNLKKMDASPSQQQQQIMQEAFGKIDTDPKALPRIIDFYKGQIESKVKEHNRRVDQTMNGPSGMQFPYDIHVKLPESASPPAAPSASSTPMKIKNDADYNALPSGSVFIDPFGKQRRKP